MRGLNLLIEEFLFFRHYKFHKQKLVLHRASMKYYEGYLLENGVKVTYIDSNNFFGAPINLNLSILDLIFNNLDHSLKILKEYDKYKEIV